MSTVPPIDGDLLDLFEAERGFVEEPPPGAMARVFADVQATVLGPSGGGGGGPASPARGSSALRLLAAHPWATAAGAFVLGAAIAAAAVARMQPVRVVYVDRPVAVIATAPAVAASSIVEPAIPPTLPIPEVAVSDLRAAASPPPASSTNADGLAAERAVLDMARSAVARGEPELALDAIERHEKEYGHGQLVEEREALAIRALVMLGRLEQARQRADRFRRRFPRSLMQPAIDALVKEQP